MARRVGLFGGTFDPPHLGHVALATEARHQLGLDVVLFVVANDPWQKSSARVVTPAAARLDLVRAAIDGHGQLEASDVEIRRGGPTYTIDTVDQLAAGGDELTLLLGGDAAAGLDSWHRADELRERVRVGVAARGGSAGATAPAGWAWVGFDLPVFEISSTDIRRRCSVGEPIDHLVAPGVAAVIATVGLYGSGG